MTTKKQFNILEQQRLELQSELDAAKSQRERNQLGQFATPTSLARDILNHAVSLLPRRQKIRFLDPAIGTGSFYSALRSVCSNGRVEAAMGFELDQHYGTPAEKLWRGSGLDIHIADFTKQCPRPEFNLLICNPPYVRHHHLGNKEKLRLQGRSEKFTGHRLGGLAGLYCHFLAQSHAWMSDNAIAVWLIPSEFMDVNYGRAVKQYLLEEVTLLQVHRFDPNDVQFADALVSSAVVCVKKALPSANHSVRFTFGGSLAAPRIDKPVAANKLAQEAKWTRFPRSDARLNSDAPVVGDLFKIRRGLATGHNRFFILPESEIEARRLDKQCFRPILPSPRYMPADIIEADHQGVSAHRSPIVPARSSTARRHHSGETSTCMGVSRGRQGAGNRRPVPVPAPIAVVFSRGPTACTAGVHILGTRRRHFWSPVSLHLEQVIGYRCQCLPCDVPNSAARGIAQEIARCCRPHLENSQPD
jgi:adenine-specific DNA-methyltransferase